MRLLRDYAVDPDEARSAPVIDRFRAIAMQWQADPGRGKARIEDPFDETTGLPR